MHRSAGMLLAASGVLLITGCATGTIEPPTYTAPAPVTATETCREFSKALSAEAKATNDYENGRITQEQFAQGLREAVPKFASVPIDSSAAPELRDSIAAVVGFVSTSATAEVPFESQSETYLDLIRAVDVACMAEGTQLTITGVG